MGFLWCLSGGVRGCPGSPAAGGQYGKIDWTFFGEVTGTNQLNIQDARSNANELLFIIEFSYNTSNAKARVSYLTPALSEAYMPIFGYYYGVFDLIV